MGGLRFDGILGMKWSEGCGTWAGMPGCQNFFEKFVSVRLTESGGSGSGKTRFWLKPNLMQLHSSYVVTDPKGYI